MRNGHSNTLLLIICLASISLVFLSGCDRYTRYKVLTFFFTGVPSPDGSTPAQKSEAEVRAEVRKQKRKEAERVPSYAHGPFASGQCNQCHATSSSATFRRGVREASGIAGTEKGGVSARLILPLEELCIDCHADKSVDVAYGKGFWVHGPVSRGICTACHSPHQSPYPFMLLNGDSRFMCARCHAKGFITETEDHMKDQECTTCHNPHIGKDRFLLKKDFDETLQ